MGRKTKKTAKELARLQQIYSQASATEQAIGIPNQPTEPQESTAPVAGTIADMYARKYSMIQKDIWFLLVLMIFMLGVLFALNYTFSKLNWDDVLVTFIAKIF